MEKLGFWVKNDEYINITGSKHIWEIIKEPEKFGFSEKFIQDQYDIYEEKLGIEGKARVELIKMATKEGWIRVRQYAKPEYWSIQFDSWDKRKLVILNFLQWGVTEKLIYLNEELVLTGFSDNTNIRYSFFDGGVSRLFKNEKKEG